MVGLFKSSNLSRIAQGNCRATCWTYYIFDQDDHW